MNLNAAQQAEVPVEPRAVTPQGVMADLDMMSRELNNLAAGMAYVARELEPVEDAYTKHIDEFEVGLYERSINDADFKLPAEAMRLKLAQRAVDPALYGRYHALVKSRDRMVKRISALKVSIEAQRSLLSALKEGLV